MVFYPHIDNSLVFLSRHWN